MATSQDPVDDSVQFYRDLSKDDSLSVTIKGAIYVDQQIDRLLKNLAIDPEYFEKIDLTYWQRVQLAVAFGMPRRFIGPLKALGEIRNKYAHNLISELSSVDMQNFYNTFDPEDKQVIQNTYAKLNRRVAPSRKRPKRIANLDPLEQFGLFVTTLRGALIIANREALKLKSQR